MAALPRGLKVAVTGGTGFVGRSLMERLRREPSLAEPRLLTRQEQAAGGGELRAALDGAEIVFHCAAELRDERLMHALHVEGTKRLIDAASGRIRRWVQLSSIGVYGRARRAGSVEESAEVAPQGEYERTKAQSDELVQQAAAGGAFELVVLRPSKVLGPGMPDRSLYELISLVDRGWMVRIGDDAVATYVCVEDLADALVTCALAQRAAGVYILSDDRPLSEFLAVIARELGRPPPRRVPELPFRVVAGTLGRIPGFPLTPARLDGLTRRVAFPSRRIREELGFRFAFSVEEGLRRLVQDWRKRA